MNENLTQFFTNAANVATSLGIPAAILAVFIHFNQRAKEHEEEKAQRLATQQEIDGDLKENYYDILKILINKPYLDQHDAQLKNPTQQRQQRRVYELVVSLFETAHMRLADEKDYVEMWNSWEDYIDEWLRLPNFRAELPRLLVGENGDFVKYMQNKTKAIMTVPTTDTPRLVA